MENMNYEQVIETGEEIVVAGPKRSWKKTAGAIGIAAILGGLAYKFVVKPLVNKSKAKKELAAGESEDYVEYDDSTEEN
jgi:hypothetical protein